MVEIVAINNEHFDVWVAGSCEPEHGAWAGGKAFYIPPKMGCIAHEDEEGHDHEDHADGPDDGRRTRLLAQAAATGGLVGGWLDGEFSLLAFNVTKKKLQLNKEADLTYLTSVLGAPEGVVGAGKNVGGMRGALVKSGLVEEEENGVSTIYINDAREGFCGLCGVDSVSGPGLASCTQAEACADLVVPDFVKQAGLLPAAAGGGGGMGAVDYKEHYLLMADLDLTSAAAGGGVNATDVEAAVAGLLGEEGDGLETLLVTVHDTTPDSLLQKTFPEVLGAADGHEARRLAFHQAMASKTHDFTQRFKLMVVATSKDRADAVLSTLLPTSPLPLGEDIEEELTAQGYDLGALQLTYDRLLYVPAYNSKGLLDNDQNLPGGAASSSSTFSVSIQDPAQPAVPVTHAHYAPSNKYHVFLAHFPPSSTVALRLFKVGGGAVGGLDDASWPLGSVVMDAQGTGAAALAFQSLLHKEGDYYVKATEAATGIYNFSPVFALEKGARRRKLYGPLMYV